MAFELQGHRGACGLRPENTLPSFEAALDLEVASVETDLHLTRDGVLLVYHDPFLPGRTCWPLSDRPPGECRLHEGGAQRRPTRLSTATAG
jgi:glycerophosphoryl diester phosphodiesterase